MLNFRNILVVFSIILILIVGFDYIAPVTPWIYAGIVFVLILILSWGAKKIQLNFYVKSYCYGNRLKNEVAITFDDGPDAQVTPMILDILKINNVKATFFIIGSKARRHPELIQRINKEGHIIGGHSYSHHFLFDLFSSYRMKAEMQKTDDLVFSLTGKKLKFFRPPYGVTNPPLAKSIKAFDYQSIGWSLKSNDTVIKDETKLAGNLSSNIKGGDIVLFHDNKPWTVNAVDKFIHCLGEKGYSVAPLDTFLKLYAYDN